jgi:hypothetical protein
LVCLFVVFCDVLLEGGGEIERDRDREIERSRDREIERSRDRDRERERERERERFEMHFVNLQACLHSPKLLKSHRESFQVVFFS